MTDSIQPDMNTSGCEPVSTNKNETAETTVSRMSTKKKNKRERNHRMDHIAFHRCCFGAAMLRFFVFEFILVDGPSMEAYAYGQSEIVLVEKVIV